MKTAAKVTNLSHDLFIFDSLFIFSLFYYYDWKLPIVPKRKCNFFYKKLHFYHKPLEINTLYLVRK